MKEIKQMAWGELTYSNVRIVPSRGRTKSERNWNN